MNKITPFLWFDANVEEVAHFYASVFDNVKILGASPMHAMFEVEGQLLLAFNGGPQFRLNESFSLMVNCNTQEEIDDKWNRLTADGGQESRCGWLKDKYGLSWQIVPANLAQLLQNPDREKSNRVMQAMMGMNKMIIQELQDAFDGK